MFEFERPANSLADAAVKSRTRYYWYIYGGNDYTNFDFDYVPVPWQSEFTHVWPSQWQRNGGVYLARRDVVEHTWHFRTEQSVRRLPKANIDSWHCPNHVDLASFDFSWHPDPHEPDYEYHFGTQWQSAGGPIWKGTAGVKIVDTPRAQANPNIDSWHCPDHIDLASFDFSWHPNPLDPDYEYHFGTQWQSAGGPIWKGTAGVKIVDTPRAQAKANIDSWQCPNHVDLASFDFSWHPNPLDPPYIYEFATQWNAEGGPVYTVPGAIDYKYIDEPYARLKPNKDNWEILYPIHEDRFDWSWRPHPKEPPYIYVFGNQWHAPERMPTVEYQVPGATERKYMDIQATLLHSEKNWEKLAVLSGFDYSWVPDPLEPPYTYVFGNQHYPGTIMPTIRYTVPGATQEKFVDTPVAKLVPNKTNWEILEPIDETAWDWTWVPNPKDPPYIYDFGNQWNPPEYKASIRYTVPGATEVKYMEKRTQRLPQPKLFGHNIAVADFDYSWEPNPFDPPFTYVFGNQWNPAVLEPTVVYTVAGATETKYIDDLVAQAAQDTTNWEILDEIESFDYSWRPNPTDPPYIYVFGNQWLTPEQRPAVRYRVPSATQLKYIDEPKARRVGNPERFITHYDCNFDYSWEPDPGSPPYNYVFGNQWWPAEVMPTVEYQMTGATETKFMSEPAAKLTAIEDNWITLFGCEFDRSWCPDPGSPAYIYVFGNQWYPAEIMPTVEYHMLGATERKYVDYHKAQLTPIMDRWTVPEEVDQTNIDFTWHPHPKDSPYIYHFGTEHQMSIGLTYTAPGATELKFEGDIPRRVKEKRAVEVVDIFYVDRSNPAAGVRFDQLRERYPNVQRIRYANSMMATIQRCVARARTSKFWVISSEYSYVNFDFTWHAQPWQSYMTHVFPSQHNKWSDTFLINRWEFERHAKWASGLEQFPNLNFVTDQTVTRPENLNNIYYVDHGNPESANQFALLQQEYPEIVRTRFVDNYLDVMKRIMSTAETEYVWVLNSICNYDFFDFTWKPEPWQAEMIHCFGNRQFQNRGDTFYIHVESFKTQMVDLELLDWFNVINYCEDQQVDRWPTPVHLYTSDNLIEEIKNYEFTTPYVFFTNQPDIGVRDLPCLWTRKDRTVKRITRSGASVMVPRDIKADLVSQIYDYPYLEKSEKLFNDYYWPKNSPGLDIVYISNGEPDEERWYEHLCYQSNTTDIEWVRGVNGRTAAYQEAARRSTTPWFFAVFAKLEVAGGEFPWFDWQPDYWQGPKHYIFNARNPLNGLEYGHQGIIAYNKNLVLANNTPGIDFTLSQPHESVPILSGTAHFNQTAWMTWRTAFREVVKLKHFNATEPTLETEHRLNTWLTVADGDFAADCLAGARDAVEYYDSVDGDYEQLKLSFEWAWLQNYYDNKY